MIKGMTGFGASLIVAGKVRGTIEIKSVNHRYLDVNYYLPTGFACLEDKVRQIVHRRLERGRVTVSIKITDKPSQEIYFNKEAVRTYLKYAQTMQKNFDISGQLTVSDLIRLPGVVEAREMILDPESIWPAVEKSLNQALLGLTKMRASEGRSLVLDIGRQLSFMLLEIKKIQLRAKIILKEKRKLLTDEEFGSFQKSNDVNEEIARLTHYIDEFKGLLKTDLTVGKKLDFIAQEMQRETNTIGSKLQDRVVSNSVIALKSKVEKIREQSQNIE